MNIVELFSTNPAGFIVKLFLIVTSILYLVFALVMYRQTQMMVKTIQIKHNWGVIFVSFAQILVALILIFIAFVIV